MKYEDTTPIWSTNHHGGNKYELSLKVRLYTQTILQVLKVPDKVDEEGNNDDALMDEYGNKRQKLIVKKNGMFF